jgi:hypothetical protein
MTAHLVANDLMMAVWRRGRPDAPVHHWISPAKRQRSLPAADGRQRNGLQHEPVGQRLGQRGNGGLLLLAEDRRTERKIYRTRNRAKADVFDNIERFYKAVRRQRSDISALFSWSAKLDELKVTSTEPEQLNPPSSRRALCGKVRLRFVRAYAQFELATSVGELSKPAPCTDGWLKIGMLLFLRDMSLSKFAIFQTP